MNALVMPHRPGSSSCWWCDSIRSSLPEEDEDKGNPVTFSSTAAGDEVDYQSYSNKVKGRKAN